MSDCKHCDWTNIYQTCTDGSREYARYEHMREKHALIGYTVTDDANDEPTIWRGDELFPIAVIRKSEIDDALWDVLVNAIEGGQS